MSFESGFMFFYFEKLWFPLNIFINGLVLAVVILLLHNLVVDPFLRGIEVLVKKIYNSIVKNRPRKECDKAEKKLTVKQENHDKRTCERGKHHPDDK